MTRALTTVLVFASLGAAQPQRGVTAQPKSEDQRSVKPIAPHVIYEAFFRHLEALDRAAVDHDRAGRDGNEVREYYENVMKLKSPEAAEMKRIAFDCLAAIRELDARAAKIIAAAWAVYPDHRVPPGARPPAIPAELSQLDRERVLIVNAHIQALEAALDPDRFRKADAYIQDVFSKQVRMVPVQPQK